jgi:two-component system nitrogen regulation sensor histidine kinase NtrY
MAFIKSSFNKLLNFARKVKLAQILTTAIIGSVVVSASITYIAITNPTTFGFGVDPSLESNLLILNIGLLLVLAILVSRKLIYLWLAREKGRVGSRLLLKLVLMFSLVAIVPSIVVGLSSSFYLNLGIKSWFDERVSDAVVESVKVADAYLKEHKNAVNVDALYLADQINANSLGFAFDNEGLEKFLNVEASRRALAEAVVFQPGKVIASSKLSLILDPLQNLTQQTLESADKGEIVILSSGDEDKVTAVIKLNYVSNSYLLISRFIDTKVLEYSKQSKTAADEYLRLKNQIADFQVKSTVFFVLIAFFLLLGALWMAFRFANNLVAPLTSLVSATDKVKQGEFAIRVKEGPENDEIGVLSRSFNKMAEELEGQKRSLILAKREAEEKSHFTQAILADLSTGVMVIDVDKKIALLNRAAKEIFIVSDKAVGKAIKEIIPEFDEALIEAEEKKAPHFQKQVAVRRKAKRMNFILRISPQTSKNAEGFILTFDDITELVSAQRTAAWSDVARKIAHEIKNPLTPINLSAQRLAKKYLKLMPEEEKENFEGYTNTISRHTADIANIIQEFSNFAKLPAPKFARTDLSVLLKDAVFSGRVANSKIEMELDMQDKMETMVDGIQITQVLTNVIKNAAESLKESKKEGAKIKVTAKMGENIEINIDDNGKGFPEDLLDRLTEPYVTTRAKGTGLGLAIVKKIMEDHNGKIELSNTKMGARVKLILPIL